MQLESLFYRRPRLLVLTLALIVVSGLASWMLLPRAEDPSLTPRNAQVFTLFAGADAERVEALVTESLEDELREFEEIRELVSVSRAGISSIQIELHDDVSAVADVWSRVRDELADVAPLLPEGATAPELEEFTITAYTRIVGLTWDLPGEPERAVLGRLADDLADALRAVPGTEDADVHGAPREEVRVEIDPARLVATGLDAARVAAAVREADAKVAAGIVRGEGGDLLVEVSGEIEGLDRLRALPVDRGPDGRLVRLGDLGRIEKSEVDPPRTLALVAGRPGVTVSARMQEGRRVDHWAEAARARIAAFEEDLPRGVALTTIFDQSRYTRDRLSGLGENFVVGAGLVLLVIFLVMGWRAALVVGSALPLTTLMVLQGMRVLGVPMHQMSIAGLIIALGLLIDNAIVVVDEVRHRLDDGLRIHVAVGQAVRHLAVPLFGSTLTTCLAFAPIALMPGPAGEFVGPMALSVILAVGSSFLLALTVTPSVAGWLERVAPTRGRKSLFTRGLQTPRLDRGYSAAVRFLVRRPALGVAVAFVLPLVGFHVATRLPEQFFPPADRDQFGVKVFLERAASIDESRRTAERLREVALEHPRVEEVHLFVGESAPKFYYNLLEDQREASFFAQALVQLDRAEDSIRVVREVQDALDAALPDALVLAQQIEQGPPFDAPVELHVVGPDLDALRAISDELRGVLAEVPGVVHTRSTLLGGAPKLRLELDEEAARSAGLANTDVARLLDASLEGAVGGSLVEATEELPVRVRVAGPSRRDAVSLATLELPARGGWTPLSSLGRLELEPETAGIPHRQGRRATSVQGFLTAGTLPSTVLDELLRRLDERGFEPPRGYELQVGGESAERDQAVANLASSAAVLFVLMAAALALTFDSFLLAGLIGLVGGLSVGLALLAVALFGHPFGFMAIVGAMGLVGVAINDSIVVLAALRDDPHAREGDLAGTVRVVRRATRHVLSTTATTMAGFTPLILAGGGFWPPVAVAIGGGVAGATLIALSLVPSAHRVFARLAIRRARRRRSAPDGAAVLPLAGRPVRIGSAAE